MANIQNNRILYTASSKLSTTTSQYANGLHTNAFNVTITSHTFSSGNGVIEFNGAVTTIGDYAFRGCSRMTSVTIPDSVTSIGNNAFLGCGGLSDFTISTSITSIGNSAFQGCSGFKVLIIPDSVLSIGDYAFRGCGGMTRYFFESTTPPSIGTDVFLDDSGCDIYVPVASVNAYKTATNWSTYASRIKEYNPIHFVDPNVVRILNNNGVGSNGIVTYEQAAAVTDIGQWFRYANITSFDELQYFTGLTYIQNSAFYGSGLAYVTLPNTITSIGSYAFYWCNYLTSIVIPDSVTSIGEYAFWQCSWNLTSATIGNGVTVIPQGCFFGCSKLASVTLPNTLTTIGADAFRTCDSLTTIAIPNSVTTIGDHAFYNSGLKFITIPNSVTTIGSNVFQLCDGLTHVTIPNSVTSIGDGVFEYCTNMLYYRFTSTTPPSIGTDVFANDSGCDIYVPEESVNAYKTAENWVTWESRIKPYDPYIQFADPQVPVILNSHGVGSSGRVTYEQAEAVTDIGTWFRDSGITSFDELCYFTGLTSIQNNAFYGCDDLTSVIIPYNVTSIGDNAFYGCSALESIVIQNNVTSIGQQAFGYCTSLESVIIPNSVTSIGTMAFGYCTSLDSVTIGSGLTSIGQMMFKNCSGLTSIIIPNNVTSIGQQAFQNCTSLESVRLPNNITSIPSYGFDNCTSLTSITIPESVTTIGNYAFSGCSGFTSFTVPDTITSIGNGAFYGCTGMEGYYFDSTTPPTIGTDVFANDSGCYIYVPDASVTAYKTATNWTTWEDRIFCNAPTTPKPTISPNSGLYIGNNVTVSISSTAISGTTYYTTNGTTPTSGSTEYTSPFQITTSGTTVVKAISYSDYYTNKASVVATNTYELYNSGVKVKIDPSSYTIPSVETHVDIPVSINATAHTGNAVAIYYTTDGTTPTSDSTQYTQPFTLGINKSQPKTVKALAVTSYSGTTYTDTDEATYLLQYRTQQPTVLPQSGNYYEGFILDITYPNGSDVYYTTDGSTPTSGSTKYTEQIYVDADTTFKAIAYDESSDVPDSEVVQRNYTFSDPTKSHKAPRNEDNFNGIYVKDVDYSGTTPSILDEADVTWGYRIDNADENLGEYGTRCHVEDTSILIHIDFTHGGKDYSLDKEIPVTCIVQDAQYKADILDLIQGSAIVTLNNTLEVSIRAKVTHTSESQTSSILDLTNFTLSGTSTNGNFTCSKEGSYFVYDDTLTYDYKGSTHPANDITLTLINNNTQQQLSTLVIPVTFQAGSIFDVKDDAIRMAVASSITYTDSGITYVNNRITDVEINVSGLTSTVSSITTDLSGVTYDVSQIEQRCDRIETRVTNISGDMVTHSEIIQVATAITANVYDELNERTGIDIYNGTITLDADYTYITGNLMLSGATDGISFSDASGNTKISLSTSLLPNLEQFDMGAITKKMGGGFQDISAYTQSIVTTFTDVPLGQYSQGQTIQIDYIRLEAYFTDAPFDVRLANMSYIITIKQNSTVIGTHSGNCTRINEGMDEFTTGSMSTTATGTGDVTLTLQVTSTNSSSAEPKTGRWKTAYNMLYQKVEVAQTTIRLNGLATFQDTTHYAWLGPDQTAFRQGESTLRIKNGRIERTPINSEGGVTSSNFADVSTVIPYNIINELTYTASTVNDGLIVFSTVVGATDSAQRSLYLEDPIDYPGKMIKVKNSVGNNTMVYCPSEGILSCHSTEVMYQLQIEGHSTTFISDGFNWIQFHEG